MEKSKFFELCDYGEFRTVVWVFGGTEDVGHPRREMTGVIAKVNEDRTSFSDNSGIYVHPPHDPLNMAYIYFEEIKEVY